jgi:leader peptidase (prepilin peptidase)/N-methyltransferase
MIDLVSALDQSPALLGFCLFLFGSIIGSFINVVAIRLPARLFFNWKSQCREILDITEVDDTPEPPGLISPRSRCPSCEKPLRSYHNIPILGYLFLSGKCGYCSEPISIRYPVVELGTALLWVQVGLVLGMGWPLAFALLFTSCLVTLALIDLDHQILPDNIVLPLLWIGLAANSINMFTSLGAAVAGAISGYMILWIIYQVHHRLTGKEGMGYGDFKLLACIGAWLGWQSLPMVILLASITGTLFAIGMMVVRKQGKDIPVAFGPYLALGGLAALLWGETVMTSYVRVLNL